MPYVERENGKIVGIFANPQPGYAEEWVEESSLEVKEFGDGWNILVLYPVELWSRMTNEEAEAVEGAISAQPIRIQNIFRAASSFRSDHELWPLLHSIAADLFGEQRAAEILEASAQ